MPDAAIIRDHLFSLTTLGIKYDLNRIVAAADACGNPQNAYQSVHVAGTNGKGSTSTFCASALARCSFRVGLFMSPHLVRFEERFLIDGKPIDESLWVEVYGDLRPVIDRLQLTFFEASTLIAFELFKRRRVDWAVFETGLGGRLDATNIIVPRVSIVTRLAMDHREYLGETLASVASEKLGIVKPGVPLVMAKPKEQEITLFVERLCRGKETLYRLVNQEEATNVVTCDRGSSFDWEGRRYRINLVGDFQVINALLALNGLKAAGLSDYAAIAAGLADARLPGRFQILRVRNRTVVFDVGHNPNAAEAFCRAFKNRFGKASLCLVLGIMKDKDIHAMMRHYDGIAKRIICCAPATTRATPAGDLVRHLSGDFPGECQSTETVASAVDIALNGTEEIVCIAGSFFTVGEGMAHLGIEPYVR